MGELEPNTRDVKSVDVRGKASIRVDDVVADLLGIRDGFVGIMTSVVKVILSDAFGEIRALEDVQIGVESAGAEFLREELVDCVVHGCYIGRAQALQHSINTHWIRL